MIQNIHHIAIICSDYEVSKKFYPDVLGLQVIKETYRADRESFKPDLALNGQYVIELFSFPDPPKRLSRPESTGLRHLAFAVTNLEKVLGHLSIHHIPAEPIRVVEITNKRFCFIADPDGLPIEFYEISL